MQGVAADVAADLQARLDALPLPGMVVPWFLANVRHECAGGHQRSLALNEHYERHDDGVHAVLWREGSCRRCSLTARSEQARVVIAAERPPLSGRVAR